MAARVHIVLAEQVVHRVGHGTDSHHVIADDQQFIAGQQGKDILWPAQVLDAGLDALKLANPLQLLQADGAVAQPTRPRMSLTVMLMPLAQLMPMAVAVGPQLEVVSVLNCVRYQSRSDRST